MKIRYKGLLNDQTFSHLRDAINRGYSYAIEMRSLWPTSLDTLLKKRTYFAGDYDGEGRLQDKREGVLYAWIRTDQFEGHGFLMLKDYDDWKAVCSEYDWPACRGSKTARILDAEPFTTESDA